jgi:hypothetical protein
LRPGCDVSTVAAVVHPDKDQTESLRVMPVERVQRDTKQTQTQTQAQTHTHTHTHTHAHRTQ